MNPADAGDKIQQRLSRRGQPPRRARVREDRTALLPQQVPTVLDLIYLTSLESPRSAWLGSARLGSARPGPARLGSARLGSARLGSARPGPARLGSARLGSARLGSARPGPARLGPAVVSRLRCQ